MTDIFDEIERDARARLERAPDDASASRLTELGQEAWRIQEWLDRALALVKERGARLKEIFSRDLVDAMDAVGQDKMGLPSQNIDIVTFDYYKAALPNPKEGDEDYEERAELRRRGLEWLAEHAPGVINTTITITLPKGSLEVARKIEAELVARYSEPNDPDAIRVTRERIAVEEGVHWATLTSFVKEQFEKRKANPSLEVEAPPLDILGAEIGRMAKFVPRKKAK